MNWWVYILLCKDNSYYCGITNNLPRRIQTHNNKKGAKYTKSRIPVKLVWSFQVPNKSEALRLEYKIKQLSHDDKVKLCKYS